MRHVGVYDYPVSRFLNRRPYAVTVLRYLEALQKRNSIGMWTGQGFH